MLAKYHSYDSDENHVFDLKLFFGMRLNFKNNPSICFMAKLFTVTTTSYPKKSKKFSILWFLASGLFFRSKYVLIVISFAYASKWWITWQFSHYELDNYQFDHFIGKVSLICGVIMSLSRNNYFWNQWFLSFNLRYRTWHQFIVHRKSSKIFHL